MEYTQPELYAALASYLENEEQLVAAAESEVVEWKYATEAMTGPIPLGELFDFRGSDCWEPSTRQWFNEEPAGIWLKHGFDRKGELRLVKSCGQYVVLFHRTDTALDEIHFYRDERSRFTRHIVQDGVTRVRFVCRQYRLEYDREEFEFADNRCVGSVVRGFYLDDEAGQWVETSWTTIYRYEYDDQGLLCVYRDQGEYLGNNRLVYRRRGSDPELSAKARARRPIVAYSIELPQGDEARHQAVYGEGL